MTESGRVKAFLGAESESCVVLMPGSGVGAPLACAGGAELSQF